jgi:hypothetical protein
MPTSIYLGRKRPGNAMLAAYSAMLVAGAVFGYLMVRWQWLATEVTRP